MEFKEMGWIPAGGSGKRLPDQDLRDHAACRTRSGNGHGVKVINTLHGFRKWIAAKMRGYGGAPAGGPGTELRLLTPRRWRSGRS